MYGGYEDGEPKEIDHALEFELENWPLKRRNDLGLAYVSILGDDFVEGVCVIVKDVKGEGAIREIRWGRP
jgi:hypothetical protein